MHLVEKVNDSWNNLKKSVRGKILPITAGALMMIGTSCCKPDTYDHLLYGDRSSPEGTKIEAYQGPNPQSATIRNKAYEIESTSKRMAETYDSVRATAPNHEKKVFYNVTVADNKRLEFNLEEIIVPPTTFHLYGEESEPNATGTAWDDGNELFSFSTNSAGDYQTAEKELPVDGKVDSVRVKKNGKDDLLLKNISVSSGANNLEFDLDDTYFSYLWESTVGSDRAGKEIKDGASVGLVLASNDQDTTWTALANEAYTFSKNTTNASEDYTIVFRGLVGHEDKNISGTATSDGTVNDHTVFDAFHYAAEIPFLVENNRDEALVSAVISYTGGSETTDGDGEATVVLNDLETDLYNQLLFNYSLPTTTSKDGYEDDNRSVSYNEGLNAQEKITLDDVVQTNTINYITNVSSGTTFLVEQGKTDTLYAAIAGNGQAAIDFEHIAVEPNHTLVIGARAPNKISQSRTKAVSGGTDYTETFNLEDVQQGQTFTLDFRHVDQLADNYLPPGGTFHIKTSNDQEDHTFPVNAGTQTHTITGPYTTGTEVKLWYTDVSGYEDLIHTIIRSREQPLASNGTRTDTLTTTIGALDNGLNYDLLLETNMFDDVAFKTHVNGGKEYVHAENGKRTMNIRGIMQSYNYDGTYNDDLTAAEVDAIRERAALFDQDFWTRATGLVILDVNYTEPTTRLPQPGVEIFYHREEPQPGNTHYRLNTTRENTYDYGMGFVPRGTEMFLGQFAAEATQAVDWIEDYLGQIGDIVDTDDNGNNPFFIREDELVTNMTYVGGKAPKNE